MTEMQTIDDLRNSIQSIVVKDYGDFKRKVVTYLNRFVENNKITEEQEKQIFFMKWYIQFHPTLQFEETKLWTLNQIEKI